MIRRGINKLQRIYNRQKKFSNPMEVLLNELKLKDTYIVEIEGKRFLVRENRGDLGVINEIYHRGDYDSYNFEEFDTIVDVGAHIGGFCLKFSESVDRIFSYEPNSQTYKLLRKNLELNETENVEIFNNAVSSEEGEIDLYTNTNSLRSSIEIKEDENASETVKKVSLESITEKSDLGDKTLLKLDCEGSEFKIISETGEEILNKFDAIFVEWHADAGNPENLKQRLEKIGFAIEENREEREIENNVGFIYAKSN
jgi:FkbM family methyltransferase